MGPRSFQPSGSSSVTPMPGPHGAVPPFDTSPHSAITEPRAPSSPKPATLNPEGITMSSKGSTTSWVMRIYPLLPACPKLASVPYLGSPALVHAGWVLAAQSLLLLCRALVFCGETEGISLRLGGHPHSPGPLWPPGQGTGGANSSIPPSKEASVLFSFKRQLICKGICLQSPFLCGSPGKLSRFQGGVFGNRLLPP